MSGGGSAVGEIVKEVVFGGAFGLCTGVLVKKLSLPVIAGAASVAFVVFRAAIFDGRVLAPWSPLKIDDASFTADLKRKARREALSEHKRFDMFMRENFYVFTGFGGAMVLGQAL